MTTEPPSWEAVYATSVPPWDIGRPQSVFARLAGQGLLSGRVLDAGCGTGEHALLAAAHGADAVGIDVSPVAIAQARAKAADRGLTARFEVGDVLNLGPFGIFDTVIDSGLFHVFDDDGRDRYVTALASVLRSGGTCYLLCFSDRQPGTLGPRRIRRDELVTAFADSWAVIAITADVFEIIRDSEPGTAQAWLATIRRL